MTNVGPVRIPVHASTASSDTGDIPIEPVIEKEQPKPFRLGTGVKIGMGVAGLAVGGLVGRAVASSMRLSSGTVPAMASGIGAGALGAAAAAGATLGIAYLVHSGSERNRVDDAFGDSTLELAREFMVPYDHNANGTIDLTNSTGLQSHDERVFTETRRQSDTRLTYDWWDDDWDTKTERWTETRGTSAAAIWTAADADPEDGVVTDRELARLMSAFDVDRSGTLTEPEADAFREANPVIVERWQR